VVCVEGEDDVEDSRDRGRRRAAVEEPEEVGGVRPLVGCGDWLPPHAQLVPGSHDSGNQRCEPERLPEVRSSITGAAVRVDGCGE